MLQSSLHTYVNIAGWEKMNINPDVVRMKLATSLLWSCFDNSTVYERLCCTQGNQFESSLLQRQWETPLQYILRPGHYNSLVFRLFNHSIIACYDPVLIIVLYMKDYFVLQKVNSNLHCFTSSGKLICNTYLDKDIIFL